MSYILDALSNKNRVQDTAVAAALQASRRQQRRLKLWLSLLTVVLVVNAIVLGYVFLGEDNSSPPRLAAPAAVPQTQDVPVRTTPATPTPQSSTAQQTPQPRPAVATVPRQRPADPPARADPARLPIRTVAELRPEVAARFEGLRYSTHVYADDPTLRAVVVNGKRLRQGEAAFAMTLHEITETGVVWVTEDALVDVNIVELWEG